MKIFARFVCFFFENLVRPLARKFWAHLNGRIKSLKWISVLGLRLGRSPKAGVLKRGGCCGAAKSRAHGPDSQVRDPGPARAYATPPALQGGKSPACCASRVHRRVWGSSSRPAPRLDVFLRPCLCGCPEEGCGCLWQAAAEMDPPGGGGEAGQVRCPSRLLCSFMLVHARSHTFTHVERV